MAQGIRILHPISLGHMANRKSRLCAGFCLCRVMLRPTPLLSVSDPLSCCGREVALSGCLGNSSLKRC